MSVVPRSTAAEPAAPPVPVAARQPAQESPPTPPGVRPDSAPRVLGHGLARSAGRWLAVALAVAWALCPAVEPLPTHDVAYPLWQLPLDLAAAVSILGAVIAAWRGSRHTARLALAAGALMAVETVICPFAGHNPVGWWTWVQSGLSLGVMSLGVALHRVRRP